MSIIINIGNERGWVGAFTRAQAVGAIPNGTRIRKVNSEHDDAHPDGTFGTVLGSIKSPDDLVHIADYGYFVEWDPRPRCAIGVMSFKIERA